MNPQNANTPDDHFEAMIASEGAGLRAQADGEATRTHGAASANDPRVQFERDLREGVARAMSAELAPADLRDSIASMLKHHAASASSLRTIDNHADHPTVYRARPTWKRQVWLAAAAAVMLVTALLLYGPVSRLGAPPTFARIAAFTASQHESCESMGSRFNSKMTARSLTEAARESARILERVPTILEIGSEPLARAGYRFVGLGECAVPGKGASAHLVYVPDPSIAPDAPRVSLFIQQDSGQLAFDPALCMVKEPGSGADPTMGIAMWRENGLIYYLVAERLPVETRRAFGAPAMERPII